MRPFLLACCLTLILAGCGDDEPAAPADGPDQSVSAPAGGSAPSAGAAPGRAKCLRLGRRMVGTELPAAAARAERTGCPLRVAVEDGVPQVLTEDFQPGRINVRVRDGIVRRVAFMG